MLHLGPQEYVPKQPFIRRMPTSIKSRAPEPTCRDSDPTSSKNTGQLLHVSKMKFPQLSVSLMTLSHGTQLDYFRLSMLKCFLLHLNKELIANSLYIWIISFEHHIPLWNRYYQLSLPFHREEWGLAAYKAPRLTTDGTQIEVIWLLTRPLHLLFVFFFSYSNHSFPYSIISFVLSITILFKN